MRVFRFEDAIRNVISIGGDCDTTGAITGCSAWVYYAVHTGCYSGWVYNKFDPSMLNMKLRAFTYLPKEFVDIANEFHELYRRRAESNEQVGGCTSILTSAERKKYLTDWETPTFQQTRKPRRKAELMRDFL